MNRPTGLHRIALEWADRCFGRRHVMNKQVRALRAAEEVVELAQAAHVPEEKMLHLVETVYGRPRGNFEQEIGGCMVTLSILAWSQGIDPEKCFENELCRVLGNSPDYFRQRNMDKINLGLTGDRDE